MNADCKIHGWNEGCPLCARDAYRIQVTELQSALARRLIEVNDLKVQLYETQNWLTHAERILREFDFDRCNIPVCNCGSYHRQTPEPEV